MGSCVSVHKSSQESAMKLGLSFESKTDTLITSPSPVKDLTLKSQSPSTFKDLGSKDETFFDSRAYLDSDCEDDFISVNGDFTPHGNTPVHQSFSMETSQVNGATEDGYPGSVSETPPTGNKKKLVELFQESFRVDHDINELNTSNNQGISSEKKVKKTIQDILPPKSAEGTPYVSGANTQCSSERTANGDNPIFKEKPLRSVQRCLPRLVSCNSFSERKKKMAMP
ncbi:ribulose-phosphate 3-epimerase [Hibiscus syriacus]|uniref:Ribulose-phosphate 3-epimerase n=1 Tax=Hibiscus syriacus TaxID=106335 RepID=A0A6A2XTB9_HIBSY|nr:uncharacterized protein At3g27210-like [Hibiscus syriacus]KAE8661629.1 ribulose-phosphate 3-epimerase [Hibiscus syriacus]